MPSIRMRVRGYGNGALIFQETVEVEDEPGLDLLAKVQIDRLKPFADKSMVEIEFLDELDPKERFFRFGTDRSRMVSPIAIDLRKLKEGL